MHPQIVLSYLSCSTLSELLQLFILFLSLIYSETQLSSSFFYSLFCLQHFFTILRLIKLITCSSSCLFLLRILSIRVVENLSCFGNKRTLFCFLFLLLSSFTLFRDLNRFFLNINSILHTIEYPSVLLWSQKYLHSMLYSYASPNLQGLQLTCPLHLKHSHLHSVYILYYNISITFKDVFFIF